MRIGTKIGKTFVSYGKNGVYASRWIGGVRVSHFFRNKKKVKKVQDVIEKPVPAPKPMSKGVKWFYVGFFILSLVWLVI